MTEEWKSLAIAALGVICTLLGWWGNVLWNAVKDLREEHHKGMQDMRAAHAKLELSVSDKYVKKDDLKERLQEVLQPLKESIDELRQWMMGKDR